MVISLLASAVSALQIFRLVIFVAWRNLWRNRIRSLLTVAGMVAGLTLMILFGALGEGMYGQMIHYATGITLGDIQIHRQGFADDRTLYDIVPDELLERLRRETPYDYAPRMYAAALASAGSFSEGVLLKAIDQQAESRVTTIQNHVRKGVFDLESEESDSAGRPDGEPLTVYPVVLGFQLARNLSVDLDSELVLITQAADGSIGNGLFRVKGILKPVELGFDRSGVLMSLRAFDELMNLQGGVHEIAVSAGEREMLPGAQAEILQIARAVEPDPPHPDDGGGLIVRRWSEINSALADMIELSQASIAIVGIIIFSIVALGILNTMLMAVFERSREFGLLKAIGMGRFSILAMVLLESFFLTVVAAVAGTITGSLWAWQLQVAGWDLTRWVPDGIDWAGVIIEPVYRGDLRMDHIVTALILMFSVSFVASILPAWRSTRLNVAAVLHD